MPGKEVKYRSDIKPTDRNIARKYRPISRATYYYAAQYDGDYYGDICFHSSGCEKVTVLK